MVRWFDGSMDRWFDGSLVRWFDGSLVRWFGGSLVRWFDGSLVRCWLFSGNLLTQINLNPLTTSSEDEAWISRHFSKSFHFCSRVFVIAFVYCFVVFLVLILESSFCSCTRKFN